MLDMWVESWYEDANRCRSKMGSLGCRVSGGVGLGLCAVAGSESPDIKCSLDYLLMIKTSKSILNTSNLYPRYVCHKGKKN